MARATKTVLVAVRTPMCRVFARADEFKDWLKLAQLPDPGYLYRVHELPRRVVPALLRDVVVLHADKQRFSGPERHSMHSFIDTLRKELGDAPEKRRGEVPAMWVDADGSSRKSIESPPKTADVERRIDKVVAEAIADFRRPVRSQHTQKAIAPGVVRKAHGWCVDIKGNEEGLTHAGLALESWFKGGAECKELAFGGRTIEILRKAFDTQNRYPPSFEVSVIYGTDESPLIARGDRCVTSEDDE